MLNIIIPFKNGELPTRPGLSGGCATGTGGWWKPWAEATEAMGLSGTPFISVYYDKLT